MSRGIGSRHRRAREAVADRTRNQACEFTDTPIRHGTWWTNLPCAECNRQSPTTPINPATNLCEHCTQVAAGKVTQ